MAIKRTFEKTISVTKPTDLSEIQKSYAESIEAEYKKGISLLNYVPKNVVTDPNNLNTEKFIDELVDIAILAHNLWKVEAKFQNATINHGNAFGTPGCLDGPTIISQGEKIHPFVQLTGSKKLFAKAVLEGISVNFKLWQDAVAIPGLPWYPSFLAFPGPVAPPTPNIPFPLIACGSAQIAKLISPIELDNTIKSTLSDSLKKAIEDNFIYVLAAKLSVFFSTWLSTQMVQNVMGTGPVPTFAPPYVPVGPVVNGYIIAGSGHLAS